MSHFDFDTATNAQQKLVEWAYSTAIGMELENWADFIVYKAQRGEAINELKLTDFTADVHGDQDIGHDKLESIKTRGLRPSQVYFDGLHSISAVEFENQQGLPGKTTVIGDKSGMKAVTVDTFSASESTIFLGFKTTRICHQARTIQSIQFIYATKDAEVCKKLKIIYPELVRQTLLPVVDFYCTNQMLLELDQTPAAVTYVDRRMTAGQQEFYSVMGVLFIIIMILGTCLLLARRKLKRLLKFINANQAGSDHAESQSQPADSDRALPNSERDTDIGSQPR